MASLRSPESVRTPKPIFVLILSLSLLFRVSSLDFLIDSFAQMSNTTNNNITVINDARFESSVVRLTNDTNPISLGRAFHNTKLTMLKRQPNAANDSFTVASFSTSFVFSILLRIPTSPGFGLCFFLSNTTAPPGALASQYFGLFTNATTPTVAPLLAVEFDTGRNPEFNDPSDNHLGIDLNNVDSAAKTAAGYFNGSGDGDFVPVRMRDGRNLRAWIDFDGESLQINVTVAPVGVARPARPTLSYRDPAIVNYLSDEMFVGFSASKTQWIEAQRLLAWSFSDTGNLREINVTNFPVFTNPDPPPPLSSGEIAGIAVGSVAAVVVVLGLLSLWIWRRRRRWRGAEEECEIEEWEMEYWPHRFEYEELSEATSGFAAENLLGAGGFGKVYRGSLRKGGEIAVKCVNHDSKQGLREFMAEISSMGRLQHKNLVHMRGWCKKGNLLMLVYDYMPNGSLNRWIFGRPREVLGWDRRRRVLTDVAEGLTYLHHGYDQVVVHRDIKSSNILLDSDMRARLGDFGLAKLYGHGEVPNTTRVVGTLGYLAPELATMAAPTAASDVYSFGVVVLEVACGRRPIEMEAVEEEVVLVDWVGELYGAGRLGEAADKRVRGECGEGEIEVVLKLGLACCHPHPEKRPSMREIVAVLAGEGTGFAIAPAPAPALGHMLSELMRVDDAETSVIVNVDEVKH